MFMLNAADAAQLEDRLRLSSVIRSLIEWFFTPAEVELYAPWIDLIVVFGTLFMAAGFLLLLFGPLFGLRGRRAKR